MMLTLPTTILGTMAHAGNHSQPQRIALIQAAIDAGITAIDTAPLYEFGETERLVGKAIGQVHSISPRLFEAIQENQCLFFNCWQLRYLFT